jgi:hypothetical protein
LVGVLLRLCGLKYLSRWNQSNGASAEIKHGDNSAMFGDCLKDGNIDSNNQNHGFQVSDSEYV